MKKSKKTTQQEQEEIKNHSTDSDSEGTSEENSAGNESADENETNERDLEAELAEMNDKFLRLYSEFDNFRRRSAKEKADLMKSAAKDMLEDMLPVVDDFGRTMEAIKGGTDLAALTEGVMLVHNKFANVLKKNGLEPFEAKGEIFDADYHEAITKIPAPTDDLKGKVVDVVEQGYMLNNKVLRYAKVVVGE